MIELCETHKHRIEDGKETDLSVLESWVVGHCDENNSDAYSRRECHQDVVIALTFEV